MKELVLFSILLWSDPLFANGGGYFRGGVEHAGDVAGFEPKATENVRILDEKLTINLGAKEADVEVRYLMKNVTDKKVTVRFGFPVEETVSQDIMGGRSEVPDTKKLSYCRNYQITASGNPLKTKWEGEAKDSGDKRRKGISGWLISEMSFAANEEKPVMIRFQSSYSLEEWNVSESGSVSAGIFRYRLSTAACWHGTIGTGRIILKPKGIDPSWLRVIRPVNRFRKEDGNLVWNFENLEPTLADDFEVEARPGMNFAWAHAFSKEGAYAQYQERNDKWTVVHSNFKVTASTTLPPEGENKYDASNVAGFSGMWAEGAKGPGIGEWLELTPEVQKPLAAISIKPGCFKSAALFTGNARPKKIRVDLNGEKSFKVDVPDVMEEFQFPVTGYTKSVRKIRLTFEEVWPGNRFEDLCVTGIRLHARLDKKPKIDPVR